MPVVEHEEEEERARSAAYTLGKELNSEQVEWLKKTLSEDAHDLISRLELFGYYQYKQSQDQEARSAWFEQLVALIDSYPGECGYVATIIMNSSGKLTAEEFKEVSALWQKKIEEAPNDGTVYGNAGSFLIWRDLESASNLLEKAQELEPGNVRWPAHLALFNFMAFQKGNADKRDVFAARTIKNSQRSVDLGSPTPWLDLEHIALCALHLGDYATVSEAAQRLQALDIHIAHSQSANAFLGLAALAQNDLENAKALLLKREDGYLSQGHFWRLAQGLLQAGEKQAVLDTIDLYSDKLSKSTVDRWKEEILGGGTPDFSEHF